MGMSLDDLQVSINEEKQSHFDKLHSKELMNIGKNFTADEQVDVCKVVSSKVLVEEYERRIVVIDELLDRLVTKMKEYNECMSLIEKEDFVADIRQIVRV